MSSRVVVFAFFTLVCVSAATAGELPVNQPVVVPAPTAWRSSPFVAERPPTVIVEPMPHATVNTNGQVYTPLPPPPMHAPTVTYKPLAPPIPVPQPYYFGRGIIGQPKLYVPNQPIRNFLRYLTL